MTGTVHEDPRERTIISRRIRLRMTNVWDKIVEKNQNTHFMFNKVFFPKIVPFMR